MRIILLGPPGAGKGTLAGLIKDKLGVVHIAMGDILREEMKGGSPLGRQVKQYVESGGLVPDEVVTQIIEKKLSGLGKTAKGFMLDGFPRTEAQAKDLDNILAGMKQPLDKAIYMEASLPVIIQRLTGRRVCRSCGALFHLTNMPPRQANICDTCGGELYQRADDNETTIKTRMQVYVTNTAPIINYYSAQGKLHKVDADKNSEAVLKDVIKILDEH